MIWDLVWGFTRTCFYRSDGQLLDGSQWEFVVILDDMSTEFIDVFIVIHFIYNLVESLRPVILVKEHSENQSLLLILNTDQLKFHSLDKVQSLLLIRPKQSFELLLSL